MLLKNAFYLNEEYKMVHGDLLIDEGHIKVASGPISEDVEILDCSEYAILPGLFNSHFHGYSLVAKGLAKDITIEEWCNDTIQGKIQQILFEHLDQLTSEEYRLLCMKAYVEMIKNGITFVSESEPGYWPDVLAKTIEEVGLRGFVDSYNKIEEYHSRKMDHVSFGTHLLEEEDITDEALEECVMRKRKYDNLFLTHCMENEWRNDLVYSKYNKSSVSHISALA